MRIAAGSEPASGSDSAKAGVHSPLAQRGSTRCFSSSLPKRRIGSEPSSCTIRIRALEAQALAISSTAICSISVPVPVPAVLLLEGQGEDVVLGQQLAHVLRVFRLLVDLSSPRRDPLAGDLPDRLAEVEQVLGDRVDVGGGAHAVGTVSSLRDGPTRHRR